MPNDFRALNQKEPDYGPPLPKSLQEAASEFRQKLGLKPKDLPLEFFRQTRLQPVDQQAAWERHPKNLHRLTLAYLNAIGVNSDIEFSRIDYPWSSGGNDLANLATGLLYMDKPREIEHKFVVCNRALLESADNLRKAAALLQEFMTKNPTFVRVFENAVMEKDPEPQGKTIQETIDRLKATANWAEGHFVPYWRVFSQKHEYKAEEKTTAAAKI